MCFDFDISDLERELPDFSEPIPGLELDVDSLALPDFTDIPGMDPEQREDKTR